MNLKKLTCLMAILLSLIFTTVALGESAGDAQELPDEQTVYENIHRLIDEGDCTGVTALLLDGSVSDALYQRLMEEQVQIIDSVVLDAMIEYGSTGNTYAVAALRLGGYVPDDSMTAYWEVMGADIPEETVGETESDVDAYLLHELTEAYYRSDYAVRAFMDLRTAGLMNDAMHEALTEALGFDYTDEQYLDEHGIAPLRVLTFEEKAMYDAALMYIDEGDCRSIVQQMIFGEISEPVYSCLMALDADMMDFIIAQALSELAKEGDLLNVVSLRLNGYVSDQCFEYYWENIGSGHITEASDKQNDLDLYLLSELERIYRHETDGAAVLNTLWKSGMISDSIHMQLIETLGVDYSQS